MRHLGITAAVLACVAVSCTPASTLRNPPPDRPQAPLAVDELCPAELPALLPMTDAAGRFLPAPTSPALLPASAAWICHYPLPIDDSRRSLDGDPVEVPLGELAGLDQLINELQPLSPETACTEELGPIHLLIVTAAEQQTALIIEGYGCRATVLSDLPLGQTAEVTSEGSVPGVLSGPALAATVAELTS